jgi:hypothetical protein
MQKKHQNTFDLNDIVWSTMHADMFPCHPADSEVDVVPSITTGGCALERGTGLGSI